ncbi:hypothetical protein KW800_00200 [Candidatus Parcubacteria bacterium]|nr:hypothetical protein [Candidatus Parcubacteria bacterium]
MNGYNFTERVRKVLSMAREEAARFHHEFVGPEHILLGLLREGEGVGATILLRLNIDLDKLNREIEKRLSKGKGKAGPDLPYTFKAKKVLESAMSEARGLSMSYVGTEHLLLGLICILSTESAGSNAAYCLIEEMGNKKQTLAEARKTMVEILGLPAQEKGADTLPTPLPPPDKHKELFLQKLGECGMEDKHIDLVMSGKVDDVIKLFVRALGLSTAH